MHCPHKCGGCWSFSKRAGSWPTDHDYPSMVVDTSVRREGCTSDGGRQKNETLRHLQFWNICEPDASEVGKHVEQGLASADGEGQRNDRRMHCV